jgi:hypothetical protein
MTHFNRVQSVSAAALLALVVAGLSVGQADARPHHPPDNGVPCMYIRQETGDMEFYLPYDTVRVMDGQGWYHLLMCMPDGTWKQITAPAPAGGLPTAPLSGGTHPQR